MSDDNRDLDEIRAIINSSSTDVTEVDNIVLIGKLEGGPLALLHTLFLPSTDTLSEVNRILGFPAPASYAKFFGFSDGATLFDNTLFVYGRRGQMDRGIAVENIRPLDLEEQINLQRTINPTAAWVGVGSIAAATENFSIQIHPSGRAVLCGSDGRGQEQSRFLSLLLSLVQIISSHCDERGLLDPTAETLQLELSKYVAGVR